MPINFPSLSNYKRKTETVKKKIYLPGKDWGIQEHLMAELNRLYPDQAPSIDMEMKDIYFRAGQVSVVRKLEQMQKD